MSSSFSGAISSYPPTICLDASITSIGGSDVLLVEAIEREDEEDSLQHTNIENEPTQLKKKKKKKPKKSASVKAKEAAAKAKEEKDKPPVLCISRNKHWKYISSYHGPWLQLPLELLESLLVLNLDPATLSPPSTEEIQAQPPIMPAITDTGYPSPPKSKNMMNSNEKDKDRDRDFHALSSPSYGGTFSNPNGLPTPTWNIPPPSPPPLPNIQPGKAPPPPIDPGVFRNVTSIRRLIDEAAELSVRASSGLSAAELRSTGGLGGGALGGLGLGSGGGGYGAGGGSVWSAAQTLGINPLGGHGHGGGGGRNVAMSAMRVHRLRALAVQKLAAAYKADEIASSVMVMQGGSVFDDLAEKVLKFDPNDVDAKYVHFFHEKIPSRQLAESTTTQLLDELIQARPQRLEFYRTRGIVHCFKDEYLQATKDFTYALKEARAARKAKMNHVHGDTVNGGGGGRDDGGGSGGKGGGGKGRKKHQRGNSQQKQQQQQVAGDEEDSSEAASTTSSSPLPSSQPAMHPAALAYPQSPDPLEPQLLFLRGAAYLSHAVYLIETAVLKLEGVVKIPTLDGAELRLCYLEDGKYGGVEIGHPDGPLGEKGGEKVRKYREVFLGDGNVGKKNCGMREKVEGMLRKSIRDHEKFLAHFDSLGSGPSPIRAEDLRTNGDDTSGFCSWVKEGRHIELLNQTEYAFYLSESVRPGGHQPTMPPAFAPTPSGSFHQSDYSVFQTLASPPPPTFTTYHPLLVESHFSILLSLLLLGDFTAILGRFARTAALVDGLEGYPVFLPPRSMAQAEFIEVLERLAGWKVGCKASVAEIERERERRRERESVKEGKMIEVAPTAMIEEYNPNVHQQHQQQQDYLSSSLGESSSSSASSAAPSLSTTPRSNTPDNNINPSHAALNASPSWVHPRSDAVEALECARILLAPVIARQREKAEKGKANRTREKANSSKSAKAADFHVQDKSLVQVNGSFPPIKKPVPINIPLHGPRVEVVLAWLGAVHLPELEGVDFDG
ncbi:hypothetical protein E1B28_001842 [Marasmius oreades]|uniref:Uncharacterized protein n=1 Tax=Marasmius oreades TaxID=181124 RepID=A0A9P7V4K9_9AGAR|nr:uncharacterized protein E1B28_001842 [Marasmius oreades]KAG7100057.1 hypothetical protein E1B28_001842 [Marasmius oreades]